MTQLLGLVSGKGGTGKTTVALGLAAVLAGEGDRVAVVDLDPQAGATDFLGLEPSDTPLSDPAVEAHGLTVYRGGRSLAHATDAQVAGHIERAVRSGAAVVVVDLSPAWTDVGHRALLARTDPLLVLAVKLDAGGLRAARELTQIAERRGLPFRIVGTFGKRWSVASTVLASLRAFYGTAMAETVVPEDVRASEAAGVKQPLPLYAPRSRAAEAVRALAEELARAPRASTGVQSGV